MCHFVDLSPRGRGIPVGMLEIAGGILIALAVIVLAPIWIPLALLLLIVGLFVGLIYLWPPLLGITLVVLVIYGLRAWSRITASAP